MTSRQPAARTPCKIMMLRNYTDHFEQGDMQHDQAT